MADRVALNDVPPEEGGKYALIKSKEELNAGDRRACRGAVSLTLDAEGRQILPGDYNDRMNNALLARIITEWNLDLPVPKGDVTILDRMDPDMIDRLYDKVEGHIKFLNKDLPDPTKPDTDPTSASAS